jgi:hypothetical protein
MCRCWTRQTTTTDLEAATSVFWKTLAYPLSKAAYKSPKPPSQLAVSIVEQEFGTLLS